MRTVCLDFGTQRLGVAVSDGELAVPHSVVQLIGDDEKNLEKTENLILELQADMVVVGFPINLNGKIGPSAKAAENYASLLGKRLEVPVVLHDERMSSVEAGKKLKTAGASNRKARHTVDMVAASIILQSWLDTQSQIKESKTKDE